MIKLKSRYKSFVSSVKKAILKLKEKAVSYIKQNKPETQNYNKTTDTLAKETTTDRNISLNFISLILTINRNIQKKKNTITKWFFSAIPINKAIKTELLTPIFDSIPKYNIQTHSTYHRKRLFT